MTLPRSTPCAEGVDAQGILDFLDVLERQGIELHSLMLARHGRVVAEGWWAPYAAGRAHLVYSVSKSLTSTAVGFLVQEGALTLDDPVPSHLAPAAAEGLHPNWTRVTLRHCLTMTVGHEVDAWDLAFRGLGPDVREPGTDWLPVVLATTPEHEPGTTFTYNQVATYLLSRVIHAATGSGVVEVLRPRLLEPLGIPELPWQRDPLGHELGFTGAHLTSEALLSFAQLCLDRGQWEGRRLLAPEWFDEASAPFGPRYREPSANADSVLGYGYSFWRSRHGYRADGAFGQFGLVLPEQDAAVAITAEVGPNQEVLDAFWATAFPAIGRPGSAEADARLVERLRQLALPVPLAGGSRPGPETATFRRSSVRGDTALPPAYTGLAVRRDGSDHILVLERGSDWLEVPVGTGDWRESVLAHEGWLVPVVARGGWASPDRFEAEVVVIESPHRVVVKAGLATGTATLDWVRSPLAGPDPFDLAVRATSMG